MQLLHCRVITVNERASVMESLDEAGCPYKASLVKVVPRSSAFRHGRHHGYSLSRRMCPAAAEFTTLACYGPPAIVT